MTRVDQSNHSRGIREDTVMKRQQQGLAVQKSDSVQSAKYFFPDKYKFFMNLNKLNRIDYFTKAILELWALGFSEEEMSSCDSITSVVENLIVWHKSLTNYREGNKVYIEFKNWHPHMVGK